MLHAAGHLGWAVRFLVWCMQQTSRGGATPAALPPSTAHPLRRPPHWLAQIAEEEERAKAEFKEERDVAKARAQHDKAWEKSREERVGSWRDFAQKKMKVARGAGGLKPPKQKESDAEKRYVQRAVGEQWRPGTHKPPKR